MIKKISLVLSKIVENYIRLLYQNQLPGPLDSANQCLCVCVCVCVCPTSHVPDTDRYLFLCILLASHLLEDE